MGKAAARFDYEGCRVLVTGGTSGIGAGIAAAFRDAGADVWITGTRPQASDYDADYDGHLDDYTYRSLQVTDAPAVEALAAELDRLDVLVNNAGASFPGGQNEAIPDVFEESVAINLFGGYRLSIHCKDLLAKSAIEGGGSVIGIASMSSFFAVPVVPGYGAAKAAVVQMTKNLAVTWALEGIRVNAVAPGLIESRMTAAMKGVEALEKPQIERCAMKRWGTPEDCAGPVLFLASPAARFITGQTLPVDGGYSVT